MNASRRWVLATHNEGKLAEFAALLDLPGVELLPLAAFATDQAEETGSTFVENAVLKARHAARVSGLPALADDSGLVVPALDGAPGVLSARFAGAGATDADNMDRLLHCLAGRTGADRAAAFCCVVVAMRSVVDPAPLIGQGVWNGFVAATKRGTHGFGYDPIFIDHESGRTAAELTGVEKNDRSHRAKAIQAVRPGLIRLTALP